MKSFHRPAPRRRGFSLAELMVVIVILGLLATIVVPNVMRYLFAGNRARLKSDIMTIEQAITSYAVENGGKHPESLEILTTPDENGHSYLTAMPKDPWKNPYIYEPPMAGKDFSVRSYGKDGVPGGEGEDKDWDNKSIREEG